VSILLGIIRPTTLRRADRYFIFLSPQYISCLQATPSITDRHPTIGAHESPLKNHKKKRERHNVIRAFRDRCSYTEVMYRTNSYT